MKQATYLILIAAGLLTACSSVYKSGQTPDDVYYSPAKNVVVKELNTTKDQRDYQEYISSNDDRYLKMKVHNYDYWNSLDDYSYWNDSRYYYFNSYFNPFFSSYLNPFGWGGYYSGFGFGFGYGFNPYYFGWNPFYNYYGGYGGYGGGWYNPGYIVSSYKNPVISGTSAANIFAYQNRTYNNSNNSPNYNFRPGTIANTSTNNFGTLVRQVFSSSNNNSNNNNYSNSWSNPVRTSSSSSPPPSSSAGGNSGGYSSTGSSSSTGRAPRQ